MENNYGKVNLSAGFKPTSAFPVDIRAHFSDSEKMYETVNENDGPKEAGSFDSIYYFGQLITLSFGNHTKTETGAYLVVNKPDPEGGNKKNLLKLTDEEETNELNEKIIKIGKSLDFEGVSTGLFINEAGKLAIKLTNNSGLHIVNNEETGEKGLEVKTDVTNRGNVVIKKSPDGVYGEYSWLEFN